MARRLLTFAHLSCDNRARTTVGNSDGLLLMIKGCLMLVDVGGLVNNGISVGSR